MMKAMRRGDRGLSVRSMQGLINSKFGKNLLKPDGDFGLKTEEAVKDFQKRSGLIVDGVVGNNTLTALNGHGPKPKPAAGGGGGFDLFSMAELQQFFSSIGGAPQQSRFPSPLGQRPTPIAAVQPKPPAQTGGGQTTRIAKPSDNKNFTPVSYNGYSGQGYIIKDFRRFVGSAIKLIGGVQVVGPNDPFPAGMKNECAQFVQYFGVPRTTTWKRGPRVCDLKASEIAEGTVVATLRDGKYHSDYSGRSHVGIYLSHDSYTDYLNDKKSGAVTIMDQWNGARIGQRSKRYAVEADKEGSKSKKSWTDANGIVHTKRVSWTSDGEEYYVLLTD